MSVESAKDFYQKMTEDDAFRTPFEAASTREERQQLIRDSEYNFTAEEWQEAVIQIQAASSDEELNEEELEAIAGGVAAIYGSIWPRDIYDWFK